jgi:hypothetical protein
MFIALLLISTLLEETSESLGKAAFKRKRQTVFDLAFLSLFFTEIFLVVSLFLGARFKVVPASVPHLLTAHCGQHYLVQMGHHPSQLSGRRADHCLFFCVGILLLSSRPPFWVAV